MSAITPVPSPLQAPQRPSVAPEPVKAPKSSRRWWIGIVLILGAVVAFLLFRPARTQAPVVQAIPTARIAVGTLISTIRVSGITAARNYANITAPMLRGPESGRGMVLQKLAPNGTFVKKGTVVAQIDAIAAVDHIDDIRPTVRQAELDIDKRRSEQSVDLENLRQSLRQAKADVDKAKLDLGAAEIRAAIDQEILKLAVEEAEATYRQLQADVAEKAKVYDAELKILDITRQRQQRHLDRHLHDLRRFTIAAEMDGLVVLQTIFRGGEMVQISEGDQLRPGQPFMKIVNPSSMQVEGNVNQTESSSLRVGQPADVALDAFPGLKLKGKVYSIGALAVGGWRQQYYIRNVPVRIAIDGSDPRLIPDLSAAGDVTIAKQENGLLVPLSAVHTENGKTFVWVKRGDQFQRSEVELGLRNNTRAAVISGLSADDDVRLL